MRFPKHITEQTAKKRMIQPRAATLWNFHGARQPVASHSYR
jgi:hypothetical protein